MQVLFGDCALDIDRRELMRGAKPVAIGPQVFDLLVYLVENRERVVSKDDLLGSVWGGRIVSELTLTSHINAVRKAIGDSGEEQRLIRTVSRKGFRFVGEVSEEQAGWRIASPGDIGNAVGDRDASPALALPDKPSIAVLPFQNLSGDPEQEYFADGMVEDIITALSRMRWLFVIARNSSFTYKGRAVDVKQVGRELGVRYVLEGSVRKAGEPSAHHRPAHRCHRPGRISGRIASMASSRTFSICRIRSPPAWWARSHRSWSKPRSNVPSANRPRASTPTTTICAEWRASISRTRTANSEALRLFLRAIELDPDFAAAYGMAAWCYVWRKANGWVTDRAKEVAEAERLARRAVALGKDDAVALARGGHALAFVVGELDAGAAFIDQALVLNPNFAVGWLLERLGESIPRRARRCDRSLDACHATESARSPHLRRSNRVRDGSLLRRAGCGSIDLVGESPAG